MFKRFTVDQRGNIAVLGALAMLPLVAATGAAVDYSRASNVSSNIQAATDAAALAVARLPATTSETDFDLRARQIFDTVFHANGLSVTTFDSSRTTRTVRVEAGATVPARFMKVAGVSAMPVRAVSETIRGSSNDIEVVLALDNTGSMASNSKMTELKHAAKNLVDLLESSATRDGQVKIGLVPFATSVRVDPSSGAGYRNASWIDFTGGDGSDTVCTRNRWGGQTCDDRSDNDVSKSSWRGCIQDRADPNNTNDAAVASGAYATMYPAIQSCRQDEGSMVFVQPLTTNFSALRTAINNMTPGGNTNVTIGVSWGHALLSNQAPFSEGVAYTDKKVKKFLILLTDGENTQDRFDSCSSSSTSCVNRMNARTEAACTSVKNAVEGEDLNKITLYTIRVIDGDATLLRNCASANSFFYDVRRASDLEVAFNEIANTIANLRLSH
jgi:Flp pilus assembly protein TadG